jgi:hypothetical protein
MAAVIAVMTPIVTAVPPAVMVVAILDRFGTGGFGRAI